MRKINVDLGAVVGAVAHGSETDRWFIDIEKGRVFLISADFQRDEEIAEAVDMINANLENYIPLPYLTHEDFLDEVEMYLRTLGDKPFLLKHLQEAVENKFTKDQIMQILNHDPGQKQEFGEFYAERVRDRVIQWMNSQGFILKG